MIPDKSSTRSTGAAGTSPGRVGWMLMLSLGPLLATVAGARAQPDAKPAKPSAAAARNQPAQPARMVLETRAIDLLKAASARLAAAKSMAFTAVVSYEYPSQLGPPIQYTVRYDVAMRRPDNCGC
jgi:hypothetical protein